MLALVFIYLSLIMIFGVAGVFVWILRGRGFSEFRRSGGTIPATGAALGERGRP
ncbi:hypothetical protein TA3x_001620 [Tundrisphaera sp. TA3]|uniref:hypothetical protein n=1 Tax=Tundrisphaera sp. TA3 TaxID=3435775 RepID=UPI003EC11C05